MMEELGQLLGGWRGWALETEKLELQRLWGRMGARSEEEGGVWAHHPGLGSWREAEQTVSAGPGVSDKAREGRAGRPCRPLPCGYCLGSRLHTAAPGRAVSLSHSRMCTEPPGF